ncbi:MAG TPA: hypothetical protein DDW59_02715 [Gammaproteobacteria bacterium]|nr:hypothetical protein [Gammaproteobacteria bacterium]
MANAMKPQRQLVQSNERQHTDAREAAVVPMPRKKRQRDYLTLDDSMSEFERARATSKTWDMGQD